MAIIKKRRYFYIFLLGIVFIFTIIWITEIFSGQLPYIDQWTRGFVENQGNSWLYFIFRWLTELGSKSFLIPFTIVMAIFLWFLYRDFLPGVMFAGGTLLSHLLNQMIKAIVERERPQIFVAAEGEGYSFPSGHAMISLVCYGLLIYFFGKKLTSTKAVIGIQLGFSLLILLIGISRYMIRVHYLTDVVAGYFFGFIFLFAWIRLFGIMQINRS